MKLNKESKPKWIMGVVILSTIILAFFVTHLRLKPDKSFEGNSSSSITFSPDSKYILIWVKDDLHLINVETEEIEQVFEGDKCDAMPNIATFSYDGKYILSTCSNDAIYLWEITNGEKKIFPISNKYSTFKNLSFSYDGKYIIASGSDDIMWDIQTGKKVENYWLENIKDFSSDGLYALSESSEGLELWKLDTMKKIRTYITEGSFDYATFSEGDQYVIVHNTGNYTSIFLINNSNRIFNTKYYESLLALVTFSVDGKFYVEFSSNDYFTLQKMSNWRPRVLQTFWLSSIHNDFIDPGIYNFAISPDNRYVVVGSSGGKLLVWNIEKYLEY
jgi:WD40 repeat protein